MLVFIKGNEADEIRFIGKYFQSFSFKFYTTSKGLSYPYEGT